MGMAPIYLQFLYNVVVGSNDPFDALSAYHFTFLVLPFDQRIVNERVQNRHQSVFVLA
jgi:hypothetical protein